jgi:putative ABC transport system permease protein
MSALVHGLKPALRTLAAKPAFSIMVAGMLALGIAGNVAIFSIYNGLFLRPLPFEQPDRLVDLDETAPKWNLPFVSIASPDFYAWREHNATFDSMAVFSSASFNLSGKGAAQRLQAARVSAGMLKVLRLRPELGRDFLPEEDRPGGTKVALLGYRVWREQFGGDPKILGQILKLDNEPYSVIGVLPRTAVIPNRADLWVPLAADANDHSGWFLNGIGRLKPGVTVQQARADLTRIHRGLVRTGRKENEITSPTVMLLNERFLGDFRTAGNMLLGAVGIVLLIACANIAGLMMVRAAGRSREFAIRTALGASRVNIVRQLLTESLLYSAIGGLAGILLGKALLRGLIAVMPENPLPWLDFSMDYRALLFSVAITGLAALLFGLLPALQTARTDLRASLHDAARSSISRSRRTVLSGLVVGEIGLAMVLLVTAALLFQALRNVMKVDPGFRPQNVLTYSVALPQARYSNNAQQVNFFNNLIDLSHHAGRRSAQRHPNADLPRALADCIRDHAVNAAGGQQHRDGGERSGQRGVEPPRPDRAVHRLGQPRDVEHGQFGIHLAEGFARRRYQCAGVDGRPQRDRQGLVMLAIGVPLGVAAMLGISAVIQDLLFGVKARDPIVYGAMTLAIAAIALAANLVPARRAAAVAPMEALRSE